MKGGQKSPLTQKFLVRVPFSTGIMADNHWYRSSRGQMSEFVIRKDDSTATVIQNIVDFGLGQSRAAMISFKMLLCRRSDKPNRAHLMGVNTARAARTA